MMTPKRLVVLAVLCAIATVAAARPQTAGEVTRTEDVIYGRKHGMALTLDVIKPARQTGIGVLFMVSGGWFSAREMISLPMYREFTDRGQTVFAVVHGSQPKFTIPEILNDIHRATRFVRHHARRYGVDPDRLGISGGSAGGHLSLMQGTRGAPGDPNARDAVDRESSRVQAVGCFFPPTDFLNYGKEGQEALKFELLRPYYVAFGPRPEEDAARQKLQRELSPVYFVTKETPPTLIIHGDQDALVPIQQAERMVQELEKAGVPQRLVVRAGKGHGWPELNADVAVIAEWFDNHLRKKN